MVYLSKMVIFYSHVKLLEGTPHFIPTLSSGACMIRFLHIAPGGHQAPHHLRLPGGGRRRQRATAQGVGGPDVATARQQEVDHGQVSCRSLRFDHWLMVY